jgi:hypothetical protein
VGFLHGKTGMENNGESNLDNIEYVGRRVCEQGSDPEVTFEADGSVRFLLNAFIENRSGEHISVDRMWKESDSESKKQWSVTKLSSICSEEGVASIGWAKCRVDGVCALDVIDGARANKTDTNPRHSELMKVPFLLVTESDEGLNKKRKVRIVAKALQEYFNNLGNSAFIKRIP